MPHSFLRSFIQTISPVFNEKARWIPRHPFQPYMSPYLCAVRNESDFSMAWVRVCTAVGLAFISSIRKGSCWTNLLLFPSNLSIVMTVLKGWNRLHGLQSGPAQCIPCHNARLVLALVIQVIWGGKHMSQRASRIPARWYPLPCWPFALGSGMRWPTGSDLGWEIWCFDDDEWMDGPDLCGLRVLCCGALCSDAPKWFVFISYFFFLFVVVCSDPASDSVPYLLHRPLELRDIPRKITWSSDMCADEFSMGRCVRAFVGDVALILALPFWPPHYQSILICIWGCS